MNRISLTLVVLNIGLWVGCDRSTTFTTRDGRTATATEKGKAVEITVKGDKGETIRVAGGEGVSLPTEFPSDVSIYPGSTIAASTKSEKSMSVWLKTSDPPQKVKQFYEQDFKQNGWEIKSAIDTSVVITLQGTKDKRTLMAIIGREKDYTAVNLAIQEEAN